MQCVLAAIRRRRRGACKGVAAVEFALVVPFMATLFVGIADFSLAYEDELKLSGAVAAGGQYAFKQGQNESGSTLTTDVTGFVNNISRLKLTSVSATYNNGLSATSCYCVNGNPATYTGPYGCGVACSDGSGSTSGKYLTISATYKYTAISPLDSGFFANPLSQTVLVRLQ